MFSVMRFHISRIINMLVNFLSHLCLFRSYQLEEIKDGVGYDRFC